MYFLAEAGTMTMFRCGRCSERQCAPISSIKRRRRALNSSSETPITNSFDFSKCGCVYGVGWPNVMPFLCRFSKFCAETDVCRRFVTEKFLVGQLLPANCRNQWIFGFYCSHTNNVLTFNARTLRQKPIAVSNEIPDTKISQKHFFSITSFNVKPLLGSQTSQQPIDIQRDDFDISPLFASRLQLHNTDHMLFSPLHSPSTHAQKAVDCNHLERSCVWQFVFNSSVAQKFSSYHCSAIIAYIIGIHETKATPKPQ